jgi:hypothetical protein
VDCLEIQSTSFYLCDKNHEQRAETRVRGLLAPVDNTPLGEIKPCDIPKLVSSLKLRKACGLDGIPNECLMHLWLSHFSTPWKEAKVVILQKPRKDPHFCQNLRLISLLSTASKLFKKVILKIVWRHIEERGLFNVSQFGFRACHSITRQCMRLTDYFTLNFNSNMSMAVILDNWKIIWYNMWIKVLFSLFKLSSFLLSQWRFTALHPRLLYSLYLMKFVLSEVNIVILMTSQSVWIDNWMYWTLITCNYKLL